MECVDNAVPVLLCLTLVILVIWSFSSSVMGAVGKLIMSCC